MKARSWKMTIAAFAAAAVAFGGGGVQPLSQLPGTAAEAASGVAYVYRYWDSDAKALKEETRYCYDYWSISGNSEDDTSFEGKTGEDKRWHVADVSKTFNYRVTVTDNVAILLCDGVTLTFNDGIHLASGSTLEIYCQSGGTGKLIAIADTNNNAAIGGNEAEAVGTIRIFGGIVTADAYDKGDDSAGIGGGDGGSGGTVEIYGGSVTANGANSSYYGGAGIGGGYKGSGGTVRIYGGTVTAKGGANAAGLGGGDGGAGGTVEIHGGTVTAACRNKEDNSGAGIGGGNEASGGTVRIYGGTVTATGGGDGAGIGGGDSGNGGTIEIYGGEVTASSKEDAAGIGGGEGGGNGGTVTIKGGTVNATGGKYGAGIGGGADGAGGTITINGGTVIAAGGINAAGIGGGDNGNGGTIIINDGNVTATGGNGKGSVLDPATDDGGAGIGGGDEGHGEIVRIYGGTVTATGGGDGAGIGGGDSGNGGTIEIYGGDITASSKEDAAGIGGGEGGGNGGTITIDGGTVNATGGKYGAGIGGGQSGSGGTITISNGTVTATGGYEGAGIGGGSGGSGGNITISGGTVDPTGGDYGTAIGGGYGGSGGTIDLSGGTVNAIGGLTAVAIGGEGGSVYFKGATVQMNTKPPYNGTYPQVLNATSINFDDTNVGQRVVCNGSSIAFYGTRDAMCLQKGINGVRVEPCPHASRVCTSKDNEHHTWQCNHCTKSGEEEHSSEPAWEIGTNVEWVKATFECECGYTATVDGNIKKTVEAERTLYTFTAEFGGKTYTAEYEEPVVHEPITYQKASYNEATDAVDVSSETVTKYIELSGDVNSWLNSTYVLTDNVTISDKIHVSGNVDLILCDGAELTAAKGIDVSNNGHLNIYAQEEGTGKLIVRGTDGTDGAADASGYAAIDGDVSVFGGVVEAYGGNGGVGLGGSNWANGNGGGYGRSGLDGDITVYRGSIKAVGGNGGEGGEGHTSGRGGNGGSGLEGIVRIYGGTLELSGGTGGAAGRYSKYSGGTGENGAAITAERAEIYSGATFANGAPFTLVPEKAATYTKTGIKAHYTATNGTTYGKEGNVYTPVTADELIIPMREPIAAVMEASSFDKEGAVGFVAEIPSDGSTWTLGEVVWSVTSKDETKTTDPLTYSGVTISDANVSIGLVVEGLTDANASASVTYEKSGS